MSQLSQIRTVDPLALHAVAGWNHALSAQRRLGYNQAPAWQRGDVATPIQLSAGTLFVFADTWTSTRQGTPLVRNSAVWVTHEGQVFWVKGETGAGELVSLDAPYAWWWPTGGVATDKGSALLFGSTWERDQGQPYGAYTGMAVVRLDMGTVETSAVQGLGFDHDYAWGPPHRAGDTVYMAGFNAATWSHALVTHPFSPDPAAYVSGWQPLQLEITGAPLGPLSLRRWRRGWLASAKMLCSGPELDFDESPEVAAWWARSPAGPYHRVGNLVADTTRPDWRTYQGQAVELPHVGLVALWCANADWDLPTYDVGGYGPVFAEPKPTWSITPQVS